MFDAYGTLFNVNALDHLLEDHYGEDATQLSAVWRAKQLQYTWLRTLMARYKPFHEITEDTLEFACTQLKLTLNQKIKKQLREEYHHLPVFPEVKAVLAELKSKNQLAVLSNADPGMLKAAVTYNNIEDLFTAILSADSLKLYKPRPEVYELAVTAFKCSPKDILFVSSNTWDVAGAKSYGFTVAWLKRTPVVLDKLGFAPDYEIEDISQLLTI